MSEKTLHFDNARHAQLLFNNDPSNLRALEASLNIKVTSRDGWISLVGDEMSVSAATVLFESLERSLKSGARIRNQDFVHALDVLNGDGADALDGLHRTRIQTSPKKSSIAPKNPGQQRYLNAIASHDITFGIGPAGTGKTYLAMAMAVRALREGETSRIILTRPAVEAGEALGFLPGDLYEKLDPYLRPLHDALYDMLPVEEISRHRERGTIEIAPLAYMRGRTLNNAFIILDEAQNTTAEQMLMFLTRLGFSSKAVVTGDPSQVDLPHNKKSGLHEAVRALGQVEGIALIEFARRDIVRHPLVQRIIAAYEEHRGAN
ncbi:MAG: PhoH family protein [Verrucomicrobiae bacterium]|jgi:phosphate starvation-inducible PhoH-like protein|nr:PhoH family protein [Verrucomicrobiae bacterium]